MTDPTSKQAALERVRQAGIGAGKWGTPADRNPYKGKPAMQHESFAWLYGHSIGAGERKAGAK